MKTAAFVLIFALAPLVSAQSHGISRSSKVEVQVCRGSEWSNKMRRPALRHTAETDSFPCPEYLETTVYQLKHTLFAT
jgi:hypothetical protein